MTYIIEGEIEIVRQAGDDGDIVLTLPAILQGSAITAVKFGVFTNASEPVVFFLKTNPVILIDGQKIIVPLMAADTEGVSGIFLWELEIIASGKRSTIGQGQFVIKRTLIAN